MRTVICIAAVCIIVPIQSARSQDPAELARVLESGSAPERIKAADGLLKLGPRAVSALPAVQAALGSDDAELRRRAAEILGGLGEKGAPATGALLKALADPDAGVRAHAAFALGNVNHGDQVVDALIERLLLDKQADVRRAAMKALAVIQAPQEKTLPKFLEILEKAEPSEVLPALSTLAEAGEKVVPRLRKALAHEKACYWACLVINSIGPAAKDAVPELTQVLHHKDPEVRMEALMALASIGSGAKPAVSAITERLKKDEFEGVRYAAAYALGSIGDPSAAPAVKETMSDEHPPLRVASAWAVLRLNPDRAAADAAAKVIFEGLDSEDTQTRRLAARALIDVRADRESLRSLMASIARRSPGQVESILDAVAELGAETVGPANMALASDNQQSRLYAAQLIQRLGSVAEPCIPRLITALDDPNADLRREAQFALGSIGPKAKAAVPKLVANLADADADVRHSACYALGKIGPDAGAAIPELKENLKSDDEFLRTACVWALLHIAPQDMQIQQLAIPLLIQALSDKRETVRAEAAASLGDIGKAAAAASSSLEKSARGDQSPAVRAAAAEALKKIAG